jgi:hypothetical protein
VGTVEAEVEGFYLLYGAVGPNDVGEGEVRSGCRLEALEGRGSRSGLFEVVMSANWSPPSYSQCRMWRRKELMSLLSAEEEVMHNKPVMVDCYCGVEQECLCYA